MSYRDDCFIVSQGFWVSKLILTIATRVTLKYDLEILAQVMVYVTFAISRHLYVSYRNDFFVLSGFHVKVFILTIAACVTITCDLET